MNHQDSFQYVFFDLLDILDNLEIVYQHEAFANMNENSYSLDGTSDWHLKVVFFYNTTSKKDFESKLFKVVNSTIEYVKDNRIDLFSFYEGFIAEIERIRSNFDKLIKSELPLQKLIDDGVVKVKYIGYLPHDEHYYLREDRVDFPTSPPEYDEFAYDEVYRLSREYFSVLSKELLKLSLFLRHEYNLTTINKGALENNKEKKDLLSLLKKGEISKLFEVLDAHPAYQFNEEVVILSARFYKLEKMQNANTIDFKDYSVSFNSICSSLISVIRKE
jgi:hypothetical protein